MADATRWTKRIADWRSSGMTAAEFCAANGLSIGTLRYWAYQRKEKAQVAEAGPVGIPGVRFARVVRTQTRPRAAGDTAPEASAIVVEVGAARIMVGRGFDRETLAAVVDALSSDGSR